MPTATEQQVRALARRDMPVVLSSGAGCGKTFVLIERYLAHLREDRLDVGQIVAITFTERAARQMRDRIRQAVAKEIHGATSNEDAERWHRHLQALESAAISTIHAFCANLLRQNSVIAGIDPQFEVLEDVLANNLQADVLEDSLQQLLLADTQPGNDLRNLILLYGWTAVVNGVERLMCVEDDTPWQVWIQREPAHIVREWQRFREQVLRPRFVPHVLETTPGIAHCMSYLRASPPKPESKMAERVQRLQRLMEEIKDTADIGRVIDEIKEQAKVSGAGEAQSWNSQEQYQSAKTTLQQFRKSLAGAFDVLTDDAENLTDAASAGQRFLRVASYVIGEYRRRKQSEGVVDFQDLLILTQNLLRDHPDLCDRLRQRYRVLLIDELQDTDPIQIKLVDALCGGIMSPSLFAVGDHKQSIYRFRGADVRVFQELRATIPPEGRLELSANFRSQPDILNFTNALLGDLLPEYEALRSTRSQLNPEACVEFLWAQPVRQKAPERRQREARTIAKRIRELLSNDKLVARRDDDTALGGVTPGDIVLLFRSMTNVSIYEAALRREGLDYYVIGGRAFFAQQEIYDLLHLLRTLENPQDLLSMVGILRSPFVCLSDESLLLLSRHPDGIWAGLHDEATIHRLAEDQRETARRGARFLDGWRRLKDRLPITRLLGRVFADSGYDAAMQFESLGDRKLANLWKLMDLARTFDRSGRFGLADFIRRLSDLVENQPREEQAATQPENADVIRLMSIHQAKGLEFPVVILPDFGATVGAAITHVVHWDRELGCIVKPPPEDDPPPFSDLAWKLWRAKEKLEDWNEDLRTLYVACTRAKDYLILSGCLTEDKIPGGAWITVLRERFDLQTGACLTREVAPEHVPRVRVTQSAAATASSETRGKPPRRKVQDGIPDGTHIGPIPAPLPRGLDTLQFDAEDGSDQIDWALPGYSAP